MAASYRLPATCPVEDGKQGVKQYSSGHQYAQGVGLVSQYIVILLKHNQLLPMY